MAYIDESFDADDLLDELQCLLEEEVVDGGGGDDATCDELHDVFCVHEVVFVFRFLDHVDEHCYALLDVVVAAELNDDLEPFEDLVALRASVYLLLLCEVQECCREEVIKMGGVTLSHLRWLRSSRRDSSCVDWRGRRRGVRGSLLRGIV